MTLDPFQLILGGWREKTCTMTLGGNADDEKIECHTCETVFHSKTPLGFLQTCCRKLALRQLGIKKGPHGGGHLKQRKINTPSSQERMGVKKEESINTQLQNIVKRM